MREKTQVDAIDRSVYDIRDAETGNWKVDAGLTEDIISQISDEKNDPDWMRAFRLHCLSVYRSLRVPDWGPSIEGLDMDNIVTYVRRSKHMSSSW